MSRLPTTRVLAGTADGIHTLGGRTAPQLQGHEVRNLSCDGATWWAIVDRRHLYSRSTGSRWKRVTDLHAFENSAALEMLSLLPVQAGVLVGTSGAQLLRNIGETLEEIPSFAGHADRANWYTPWGGPPETRSMATDSDGTIYVNVHVGGILRSQDGGATWKQTMEIDCDAHQVAVHPAHPRQLYAATARGLGVSRDAGVHWTFETDGLHANYQRAVAIGRDRLLVSASHGPDGRQSALYWRPLKGRRPMVKCETGLPQWFDGNINTFALDARAHLAAFGTKSGQVFISDDQGDSWRQIGDGLPPVLCIRIA